jgi:hypothetical protein
VRRTDPFRLQCPRSACRPRLLCGAGKCDSPRGGSYTRRFGHLARSPRAAADRHPGEFFTGHQRDRESERLARRRRLAARERPGCGSWNSQVPVARSWRPVLPCRSLAGFSASLRDFAKPLWGLEALPGNRILASPPVPAPIVLTSCRFWSRPRTRCWHEFLLESTGLTVEDLAVPW